MNEFIPRNEDEMVALLERAAVLNAYIALALAAVRGQVSEGNRAKIEAEAVRAISEVTKASKEFPFSVPRALDKAKASIATIFASAKSH